MLVAIRWLLLTWRLVVAYAVSMAHGGRKCRTRDLAKRGCGWPIGAGRLARRQQALLVANVVHVEFD